MQRKFIHSYSDIISLDNLLVAWREFYLGKSQKNDVQLFKLHLIDNLVKLNEDLSDFSHRHGRYKNFAISDPKPRQIHKAEVRDRVLHHAIYHLLYPFFDKLFIADSFSCRNGKGTYKALNRFRDFGRIVSKNNTRTFFFN